MTLAPGTKVGGYEVVAFLGRGGMGEVYRARDSSLHREVAIKVLPESLAGEPDRVARFRREAQVLASLNHPNIGAIFGFEDGPATRALVLELVDGPTLADRIAQGQIPPHEARVIARQIAQALEAAHQEEIVHRDLKPANIKLRPDGTVKVLDFGLAKLVEADSGVLSSISQSPTITSPAMTQAGVLLGTAPYMSPELARGRAVDKRADIWAFGCVLFEMLSGRRPFEGDHITDVLGAVVRLEPDWTRLPSTLPPGVVVVLKRCLQKDPALRARDIADVRFEIEDAFDLPAAAAGPRRAARAAYAGWIVAALASVAAVVAITSLRPAVEALPETRLDIVTPPSFTPMLAMSPDGRTVAFTGQRDGQGMVWLRALESDAARPLAGTERGSTPFWSPDGRSIAFFADGMLKRLDLANGFVRTLAPTTVSRGGTWNADGTIVFSANSVGPLSRVSAEGGPVAALTELLAGQTSHRWPQFLPDGRRFLLMALGTPDVRGVYLGALDDSTLRRLSDRESAFAFMPPAHLLFARQGALWARRLTPDYTGVEGPFIPIAPQVLVNAVNTGAGAFAASPTGSIVYRSAGVSYQLRWIDRAGRTLTALGEPDDGFVELFDLSRDGRTAIIQRIVNGNTDLWLVDATTGVSRRVTFEAAIDGNAVLSPDGSRIIYVSDGADDVYQVHERRADGTGDAALLFRSNENKNPTDWSADGRHLLFSSQSSSTNLDVLGLVLDGERTPLAIARTPSIESQGQLSPDGRWVAFQSNETGRMEIHVQPFPGPGAKSQLSTGGGTVPRWRADGRELFYVAADNRLMSASIAPGSSPANAARPVALFALPANAGYAVSPDGQRILVAAVVSDAAPITVILNWQPPAN